MTSMEQTSSECTVACGGRPANAGRRSEFGRPFRGLCLDWPLRQSFVCDALYGGMPGGEQFFYVLLLGLVEILPEAHSATQRRGNLKVRLALEERFDHLLLKLKIGQPRTVPRHQIHTFAERCRGENVVRVFCSLGHEEVTDDDQLQLGQEFVRYSIHVG